MHIQNISPINLLHTQATNKKQANTLHINPIHHKQISFKDFVMPKPYIPSFSGQMQNNDFESTINEYFRLAPDKFQLNAAKHLFKNENHLVAAPTGTGKTLIAEYIINKNLDEGKRTFYTAPLKALSNEKYSDFCKLFGKENVGLMTGDIKVNRDAPVMIMTTEIYRNMLLGEDQEELKEKLKDVATVIYDEFHYMNDPERGEVWETSIMYTPEKTQQLLLSATAANAPVIVSWMNRLLNESNSDRIASITNISPDERHVPLKYFIYDPKISNNYVVPLIKEKYDLAKLSQRLKTDKEDSLTEKQKEVLSKISELQNGNGSVKDGISRLLAIAPEKKGDLAQLEGVLHKQIGFEKTEAKRAAALLADKSQRTFNNKLKNSVLAQNHKTQYDPKDTTEKVISIKKLNELIFNPQFITRETKRSFAQLGRLATGENSMTKGLKFARNILDGKDMSVKKFRNMLTQCGLNKNYINAICTPLTTNKKTNSRPPEFDLIDTLEKENKLPAIMFCFSKKKCNNLKNQFIKTGKSLLTPEEKEKAAEIIKKHTEQGNYLGTYDENSDFLSGVAVHHAGKMPGYKALVEELAQNKLLKVVFATSTLGAGINVPAKTVVFTQLDRYSSLSKDEKFVDLTPSEFQQMAGRAGRRGKDSIGNVVIMPDKKHSPAFIYNLVTSSADPINSTFKPTYNFLSHLIAINHSDENIEQALEKSFLKEKLESIGKNPQRTIDYIKKKFVNMSKVLIDSESACFKPDEDGKLYATTKGKLVAKARGLDGLLFADIVLKSGLEYLTPEELATVACALTSYDERYESLKQYKLDTAVDDTLYVIDNLQAKNQKIQEKYKVASELKILNKGGAQYIAQWVKAPAKDSIQAWEEIIKNSENDGKILDEGDLFKSINNTVDIVQQIKEAAEFVDSETDNEKTKESMQTIAKTASKAIKLLQKDPIVFNLD